MKCENMEAAAAAAASLHILRLCSMNQVSQAASFLFSLNTPIRTTAYSALFSACARRRLLSLGRSLHLHLLSSSSSSTQPPPLTISNHLINLYSKCGDLTTAHQVFDEMPERNLVSWTALIAGYAHHGSHARCLSLFSDMLIHHLPNDFALSVVLSSCAKTRQPSLGRQVHALASKTSFDTHIVVGNALIAMYSGCPGNGDDACAVFDGMPSRSLITWNSMVAGFLTMGRLERSLNMFARMHRSDVWFDRATLLSVVPACCGLRQCSQMLALAVKACFVEEAEVATAFVKAYSGLGADFADCYRIFSGVKEHDLMSWTVIIASCAEKEPEEAISLFGRLREEGFEPDRFTLSAVVKACAGFATERHCAVFHSLILRSGFCDDTVLSNALIHAYARSSSIRLAENVFERMADRDQVSWNSIIKAYAAHGRGKEALLSFERMDVPPDSATFVGLLTACSHGGLLREGHNLFKSMSHIYGVDP